MHNVSPLFFVLYVNGLNASIAFIGRTKGIFDKSLSVLLKIKILSTIHYKGEIPDRKAYLLIFGNKRRRGGFKSTN